MRYDTGTKPPTSKDVAALAGVSQSTVSFVINGKSTVAPATRKRVEDAMRKLNYRPNAGARTLRTNRTNIIALFEEIRHDYDANEAASYVDAIIAEARKRDYDVILCTRNEGAEGLNRLAGKSICDAFILMDIRPDDARVPAAAALHVPTVLVGRPNDPMGLDLVDFDTRIAAALMVDELANTGHRHIAVVGDTTLPVPDRYLFVEDFYDGARTHAQQRGIDLTIVPRTTEDWNGLLATADQLLAHADDRLGIITRQPQVTDWILRLLEYRGLTAGTDVSLVAHCSDYAATSFRTPVTNVSTAPEHLSQMAVDILFSRLAGDASPAHYDLARPLGVNRRATTIDWSNR